MPTYLHQGRDALVTPPDGRLWEPGQVWEVPASAYTDRLVSQGILSEIPDRPVPADDVHLDVTEGA